MTPDQINGALEFGSGLLMLMNVKRLTNDKTVRGVSLVPTLFFDMWGFWNLYYYPVLGQWWSLSGGAFLVAVNLTWTALALYYGGWRHLCQEFQMKRQRISRSLILLKSWASSKMTRSGQKKT